MLPPSFDIFLFVVTSIAIAKIQVGYDRGIEWLHSDTAGLQKHGFFEIF
jgi:hypothetical protein